MLSIRTRTIFRSLFLEKTGKTQKCSTWNIVSRRSRVPTGDFSTAMPSVESLDRKSTSCRRFKGIERKGACTAIRHCNCRSSALCWPSSLWYSTKTEYGPHYRRCQSKRWRREDYDCHQPGGFARIGQAEHAARGLRSAIECDQRDGAWQRSRAKQHLQASCWRMRCLVRITEDRARTSFRSAGTQEFGWHQFRADRC